MLFLISKLIGYILSPYILIFVTAILIFYKRYSSKIKIYLGLFIALLYFFSCPIILQTVAKNWDITTIKTQPTHYSCAIVLGGYVGISKNGNGYFSSFSDRFIQATRLYNLKYVDYLLISGGNSNTGNDTLFKEADFATSVLREFHIPDTALLKENKARNTYENLIFSTRLLKERGIKPPYLLITSAFHMRRSLFLFKEKGIPVVPYSCDYLVNYNKFKFSDLFPNVETLATWNIYVHEMLGFLFYKLKI